MPPWLPAQLWALLGLVVVPELVPQGTGQLDHVQSVPVQ